jgi:predicted ATPase
VRTARRVDAGAFGNSVRKHLRAAGYFQKDLAIEIGLRPKVLSRKLNGNGNAYLTEQDVRRIITTLAHWKTISTREEALNLLELAQMEPTSFSTEEWKTPPLNRLDGDVTSQGALHMHNLLAPLTRLVGREGAVEQLRQLLGRDDVRLVTLVGPGGSGKTRLALHVANELVSAFAQGVWFVDLVELRDPTLVPQNIMQALSIRPSPGLPGMQRLTTYLHDKQLLLVLDNFEQVGEAAQVVEKLLAAAPGLKVLVTSRVVLHLYGESEFSVPPLDVPDPGAVLDMTQLARCGSVQLFVERARAVVLNFALTADNAATIAQICARVDGLPLALELAAARVKLLPPALLLQRLSAARLSVLTRRAGNLPDRQQTLRNTITWSYDLLSPTGQTWFARLGVFSGGWSLKAAEAMTQAVAASTRSEDKSGSGGDENSALDMLEQLVDNSLLVRLPVTGGQARFRMLETLREYALERLSAQGELERLRDWHACYYLAVAEAAEVGLRGPQQLVWQARLVAERDNFRAALEWSLQRAGARTGNETIAPGTTPSSGLLPAELCLRLAAALRPYWEWQGHLVEGRDWLEAALALPLGDCAGETLRTARAKALSEAARLVCLQDKQIRAAALAEESIALWRELGDSLGLATALLYRGWSATAMGDYALAKRGYEQGLQLLSPANNLWLRGQLLFYQGAVAGFTRDFEQMRALYAQSRELFEQVGDESAVADVLKDQGGMAILEGKYSEAISNLLDSIELSHQLGYKQFVATGLGLLGFAVGMRGEPDPALASLQAAKLWGANAGLMGAIGSSSWLETLIPVQEMILQIRARVDKQQWKEAWFAGQALTEEGAIELARSIAP